jgi:hypothetical protein
MGLTATSERHPLLEGPVTREVSGLKSDKGQFFFFSAPRGRTTYYVIRHQSIYGNNNIIAVDSFPDLSGMTNRSCKHLFKLYAF